MTSELRNALLLVVILASPSRAQELRYNRDVLPILSAKCFSCHGANSASRKAGLRLDRRASAIANRDNGPAIKPGKTAQSELVRRIFASGDQVMPPKSYGTLTAVEKKRLQRWVAQGAVYEKHWAFQPPRKLLPPPSSAWTGGVIDRFILARLRQVGLTPQRPASKEQLIRRLTLDLTGLPPTIAEVDKFVHDGSANAYEQLVDRLLKSPRFGERMAMWWLDGARYGDSHGYDNDLENSQWPWRNWVIESFNTNKRFDRFTIEQLAGDLLPSKNPAQVLATGFNRNHRIQTEGGAIDEEWRTEYVMDRVQTMGAVWLGLTLSCSRCHDHKYDPISQREFYQLFALFNNLDEKGFVNNLRGSAEPRLRYRAADYQREKKAIEAKYKKGKSRSERLAALDKKFPHVMIMRDMTKPRQAYVLQRGQYNARGEAVRPGLPGSVGPPVSKNTKVTRLVLARWLVNGKHPLTARVFVNRIWEQLFGVGIVKSSENLGVQGDWPSHPQLLDWLSVDFAQHGWNIKRLIKQIVTSKTYRQGPEVDSQRLRLDPQNRLLSRGPRIRLSAEMIRDQALSISGLLHEKIGGPSVHPYQPAGLWEEVLKRGTYRRSNGQSLYRRTLYTAIRRTVAPPGLLIFDMPNREVCTIKRSRTNTPLQALSLLNNVVYVEAAKKFAERMIGHGKSPREWIAWGFRRATLRHAKAHELRILTAGYERRLEVFRKYPQRAQQLLKQGESKIETRRGNRQTELAALTTVANILLNLDEIINK